MLKWDEAVNKTVFVRGKQLQERSYYSSLIVIIKGKRQLPGVVL